MRIERITDVQQFEKLKERWRGLRAGENLDSPLFTHEWFSAWLEAFGKNSKLALLALFDEKELVGVAPLCRVRRNRRGISCGQLRFLSNRHGPRCGFLMRDEYADSARLLLEEAMRLSGWDVAVFEDVPSDSYLHRVFADWSKAGKLTTLSRKTISSPFLRIEGTWESFFDSRSRNLKRSLRRKEEDLSHRGEMAIEHFTDASSALSIIDTLFALGESSWKARHGRAIGSGEASRRFYSLLAERFGKKNEVSVWLMRLDGEPVAFEFHLVQGKRVQALRGEFDERYRELGVGSVLDKEIIRKLFEFGFHEYDMGGEADFYKLRWSSRRREHFELLIFNTSVVGKLLSSIESRVVEPLKKVMRPLARKGRDIVEP